MNKADFAEKKLARELGIPPKDALRLLNAVLDGIGSAIAEGETVRFTGFGCFEPKTLKKRGAPFGDAHTPSMSVSFRPGSRLLEAAANAARKQDGTNTPEK